MKKVLIISPIVNYGGREVEVNIITKSLIPHFFVSIISTNNATRQSEALKGLDSIPFATINQLVIKQNILLRFFAYLSYYKNGRNNPVFYYLYNNLTKRIINLRRYQINALERSLIGFDLVCLVVDFDTPLLIETIRLCKRMAIPCVIRNTRTVFEIPKSYLEEIELSTLFIHHSEDNAKRMLSQVYHKYVIVDQCALNEKSLLACKIKTGRDLRYGFLGRFTEGKQILPLINYFKNQEKIFYIAGEGMYKDRILDIVKQNNNLKYLGYLNYGEIADFFRKIDVLVISSTEESGPLVGVEAMAAGKIIISTKVGAMTERLEKLETTFWLKKDLSNLNQIISDIESLPRRKIDYLRMKNRTTYKRLYSINIIQERYLAIAKKESKSIEFEK
jgi:glycosyltransferase involved in cell wall biosynthesis